MPSWIDRYPQRWQQELAEFAAAGWQATITTDDGDGHCAGGLRVRLEGRPAWAERPLQLEVVYPGSYPWLCPEVLDPHNVLGVRRHREPHSGKLCLIHARDWDLGCTAAELIDTQLPRLLRAGTQAPGNVEPGLELPAPEPVGLYVLPSTGTRVLVDTSWTIPTHLRRGALTAKFHVDRNHMLGTGAITRLVAEDFNQAGLPATAYKGFTRPVLGRWLRWDGFDPTMPADRVWQFVEPLLPDFEIPADVAPAQRPDSEGTFMLVGLLVPSETRYQQRAEEWVFLLRSRADRRRRWTAHLIRSTPAGRADLAERSPATTGLATQTVLLVGVGALGHTIATELARAGIGRLHLLDGDVVEPVTGCRQPASPIFAGYPKAWAVKLILDEQTMHTRIQPHAMALGHTFRGRGGDDHTEVVRLIRQSQLVIDATAEPAVSRYLAALTRQAGVGFLHVSATAGAHGALVVSIRPGDTAGCWACLHHHWHDHTLPVPPADPTGWVVPVGCAEPTFTGTGADLATISSHAARVAIALLARPNASDAPWGGDVHVGALCDRRGRPVPIRWSRYRLLRHPDCPLHPRTWETDPGEDLPGQPAGAANRGL